MKQKKLIIFMPSFEGGGAEKNFFIISNFLSRHFDKVYLITAEKNLSKKLNDIETIYPKSNYWRNKGRFKKYLICIYFLIKLLIKNKKIIVFSFQANLYAILTSKIFGTKVVSRSNSSPSGWSKNFIKNLIYKIVFNFANVLIVNSKEFKKEIKKKFIINPVHIYNPLNKNEILKLSEKKTENLYPKNTLKIINVGRLVDQKDQLTLLRAINSIKNSIKLKLVIIGRGKNKQIKKNYIKLNKISNLVKIFYTSNPFPYIKQADVFILSSVFEGLPNVLLEAITLKKFVISSSCPTGPKEILDNEKGGFLYKPGDYQNLAKKIMKYNENKNLLKKKITYAQSRLSRFDKNRNLKKYLNILNSI